MGGAAGGHRPRRQSLTYVVVGMAIGVVFLLMACALLGWTYLYGAAPRTTVIAAAVLGAVSATGILASIVVYTLTSRTRG